MDRADFERWIEGYLKAWLSNKAEDIAVLFTEEAKYYTQAFRDPWDGREAILTGWIERDDQPDDWTFEHEWLAVEGDSGVLRGLTTYKSKSASYSNVWLIRLGEEGRCFEFREWWVEKD
jgi:hypothetical protein